MPCSYWDRHSKPRGGRLITLFSHDPGTLGRNYAGVCSLLQLLHPCNIDKLYAGKTGSSANEKAKEGMIEYSEQTRNLRLRHCFLTALHSR
eukprot:scaffold44519_cov214-Amphora_coffeaeformis.AAC.1